MEIARTSSEQFEARARYCRRRGPSSPPWNPGGDATFAGGTMIVDGARVNADTFRWPAPGSSLTFRADLGAEPYRTSASRADFNEPPWAMFSTGN